MGVLKLSNLFIFPLTNASYMTSSSYPHAQLVDSQLFLGSLEAANDEKWLRANNVTHVVGMIDIQKKFPKIEYLTYGNIGDIQNQNIVRFFGPCFAFIERGIAGGGNVLVHCYAGISRSTTIVVGFIMYKKGTSLDETFNIVKSKRSIVFPNYGFLLQLKVFDRLSHKDRQIWCRYNKDEPLRADVAF